VNTIALSIARLLTMLYTAQHLIISHDKENTIATASSFMSSADTDNEVKRLIAQAAASSIFSHQPSGFIKAIESTPIPTDIFKHIKK
jgi:hypothetical protein